MENYKNRCYLCNEELTEENQSDEHILLNALGGHLTSKRLLCKSCNSKSGENADSELAKQLNFYANILMIKRDNGEPQAIIMERPSTGKKYRVGNDGKPQLKDPVVIQKKSGNELSISIQARDEKEAKKILQGFAKKYKNLNVDEFMSKAQHVEEQIDEPLHITVAVGGKEALPSILKTAINYYIELTHDTQNIDVIISELKTGIYSSVEPIILEQGVYNLDEDEISHSIYLYGKKDEKLYAIVDYFNIASFIVKLSDNYFGKDIESLYVFDVLKRTKLKKKVSYRLSFNFVFNFEYPKSNPNFKIMKDAASRIMSIAMRRQHEKRQEEIMKSAWDKTIGKMIPEGEIITEEAISRFSEQLQIELRPYLKSLFVRRKE